MKQVGKCARIARRVAGRLRVDRRGHATTDVANNHGLVLHIHHARPFRRRHIVALALLSMVCLWSGSLVLQAVVARQQRSVDASLAAYETMQARIRESQQTVVQSSSGFSVRFDPGQTRATAIADGVTYDTATLSTIRPYTDITFTNAPQSDGSSLRIFVAPSVANTDLTAEVSGYVPALPAGYRASRTNETVLLIGDLRFARVTYDVTTTRTLPGSLQSVPTQTYVYAARLENGRTLVMQLHAAVPGSPGAAAYQAIIQSISRRIVPLAMRQPTIARPNTSLPRALQSFGAPVVHADTPTALDSAQLVALYAPAVVKLYHMVCATLYYQGEVLREQGCTATTGTGFFVSGDGVIATNGHVATLDAHAALTNLIDPSLLDRLLAIEGYSPVERTQIVAQLLSSDQARSTMVAAINAIPDDQLYYRDKKDTYIVALGKDVPDMAAALAGGTIPETATVKQASLIAADYDAKDLTNKDGFTQSDVALLRVAGKNFPHVRLGTLSTIQQGAALTVIGYPSDAESNGLINADQLQSTATRGIVSAIRDVRGTGAKVVQSDVSIGHGNSGGPAFDQTGAVFGLATYVLNGSDGGASISYLRDVHDLKSLMSAQNVAATASDTQRLWEAGLSAFYGAHFTDAVRLFAQVKQVYPAHVLADQYIALSQAKIAAGEEAPGNGLLIGGLVIGALSILSMGIVGGFIVRHRAHHHVYKAVASGSLHGPLVNHPRRARS